jgi:two-component system response regulator AtoC
VTGPFRLLIIDDDLGVREYLSALLGRFGHTVFTASSGEEALEGLTASRPDLITLDVVLEGMDGIETLRRLKKRLPDVPVVMISGHGHARTIVEAMQLGAADFLRKPFEVEELQIAFQRALETRALRKEVEELRGTSARGSGDLLLGSDDGRMREVRETLEQVADTDITVLIRGESGTGKELVARTLHRLSGRNDKPFVKVNCAALPSELLESELFGFEKGAFTGAQKRKLGKFEFANGGTIFLDEIAEMSPPLQAKLLQVLQDGEFSRLGGERDVQVDTRVLAATNRDLEDAVAKAEFREDLFYRLNVVTVTLPPLRERGAAIPFLIEHFLEKFAREYKKTPKAISVEALATLVAYPWPGNVRELENMLRRIVVLGGEQAVLQELTARTPRARERASDGGIVADELLTPEFANGGSLDLKAIAKRAAAVAEKRVIARVLEQTRWNRKEAAGRLQISYKALLYKMKDCGLSAGR